MILRAGILLLGIVLGESALASTSLDNISKSYQDATGGWYSAIFPFAQKLFFILAVIELTWSGLLWALNRDDPGSLLVGLLRKFIALGLFYAVLLNAHSWIPAVIKSFMGIGAAAGGMTALDPSALLDQGIEVSGALLDNISVLGIVSSPVGSLLAALCALIVVVAFAVIAGQLLITLIESYIVIGGGVLMLGFSGSRWTSGFAEKFLGYAVAVGVKLFVLYLIIGVGAAIAPSWSPLIATATLSNPAPFFEVIAAALIFAFLAWSIPSTASSLIAGSVSMTLGGAAGAGILTGAGLLGGGAAIASGLTKSMQTLNRTMQTLTAATRHGSAIAGATGSTGAGLKAGAGSLLAETGRAAAHKLTGGYNPHAAAIGRRTAAFREQRTANMPRPRKSHERAVSMAHHLPKDQADGHSAEVKMKHDD
jgi:type IV secretion system protein TrbL